MQPTVSVARVIASYAVGIVVIGALMFGVAGSLDWPAAWVFLLAQFAFGAVTAVWMAKHAPERLAKRREAFSPGQPIWDRLIVALIVLAFIPYFVLPGLDAVRFGWSRVPGWLQLLGFAGVAGAEWLYLLALSENPFLSRAVQPQAGQTAITTGPYAVVRHPMYAAICLLMPSVPLALGSLWGVLPGAAVIALTVARTVREEQYLRQNVPGYAEYARTARWRLIPRLW